MPQTAARSGRPLLSSRLLPTALSVAVLAAAPASLAAQAESEPSHRDIAAFQLRVADALNAKPKRTKRQKTALWLMGIGSAAALAGYLEDSESRCRPGLEHSYLGYDCYADTPRQLHYRGGNDDVIYGGAGLAILGLVIGLTGRKADDSTPFRLSLGPAGGIGGRPSGLAVNATYRIGGRR